MKKDVEGQYEEKGRFFITGWNITTNQFEYSIVQQNEVKVMGEFSEGLNEQELAILVKLIQKMEVK